MKRPSCEFCSRPLTKNGVTSKGRTRWRCRACGVSSTKRYDPRTGQLKAFLAYLTGKATLNQLPGGGRTFQRHTAWCWRLWPQSPFIDEVHPVIFIDGIHLGRSAVMLIAATSTHVLGWYFARRESSWAYRQLLSKIAPPHLVVSDGGSGLANALSLEWPNTIYQRCLFHVFNSIKRCTTMRPKTQAGIDLYALARALLHVDTPTRQAHWQQAYERWCATYKTFLAERTQYAHGTYDYTHRRLRRARRILNTLLAQATLFAFLASYPQVYPSYTNQIESINARLRHMLRTHRGYSLTKRAKAIMWWCYLHSPPPMPYTQMITTFPTDEDMIRLYQHPNNKHEHLPDAPDYGQVVLWHELHHADPYRTDWD